MKHRALLPVAAAVSAAVLSWPAAAAPSVPAPTSRAVYQGVQLSLSAAPDTCLDPNVSAQHALTAQWSETKRGRDATFVVQGTPEPLFASCVQGVFTSAPVRPVRRGKVGAVTLTWSGQQSEFNSSAMEQIVRVRFTDSRGRWGPWVTTFSGPLTEPLSTGAEQTLVLPVSYRGQLPVRAVQFQVMIEDRGAGYVVNLRQTARVTT